MRLPGIKTKAPEEGNTEGGAKLPNGKVMSAEKGKEMAGRTKAAANKAGTPKSRARADNGSKVAEKKAKQIKGELGDKLDDLGIEAPSMDVNEYIRVLKFARKPSREEFMTIGKISIAGIALIGMIGFVIYALLTELPRSL